MPTANAAPLISPAAMNRSTCAITGCNCFVTPCSLPGKTSPQLLPFRGGVPYVYCRGLPPNTRAPRPPCSPSPSRWRGGGGRFPFSLHQPLVRATVDLDAGAGEPLRLLGGEVDDEAAEVI